MTNANLTSDHQTVAVLIDADNTQLSKLESVLEEIAVYGRITVKRAYGNWTKQFLINWPDTLKRLAIKAEQQFDYVAGKNATDMALVIDAMELLYTDKYDNFVIVISHRLPSKFASMVHALSGSVNVKPPTPSERHVTNSY